ncbi:hypothetical protein CEXT_465511 [Caerostris extrusa]|uniref:Uncharacterized protein n=1 Tax=Caerostris extrusa TaxID=172846 RepID=A0AAV4TX72_CAEEX|nr:hypothetical protein CEXT_465511 [Caerostris extrusa]
MENLLRDLTSLQKINAIYAQVSSYEELQEATYQFSVFDAEAVDGMVGGADGLGRIHASMTEGKESLETLLTSAETMIRGLTVDPKTMVELELKLLQK